MATDNRLKIAGGEYWLFIDPERDGSFDNIVCLTDHNLSLSNATNTTQTYCGSFSTAGDQTTSIAFNGLIVIDPETGEISAPDIFTLAQNRSVFDWKYARGVDPTAVDFIKSGAGFFSAYNENFSASDFATFGGTIQVDGPITQEFEIVSE